MNLRPYQSDAIQAISRRRAAGVGRQILVLPTGAGKTVVFSALASAEPGRVLVLIHREELAEQAADKIARWGVAVGVEMAERRAGAAKVVVGSVATLGRKGSARLAELRPEDFSLLITDEVHHGTAASYLAVYEHFGVAEKSRPGFLHLGVTATPNRADGEALSKIADEISYQMTLREAIEAGWLSDLRAIRVQGGADVSGVRTTAGDLNQGELAEAVNTPARNRLCVEAWKQHAPGRRTLAFCVDVQHALDLAEAFQRAGTPAVAVWGDDPMRRLKIAGYRAGDVGVMTNCAVATEGFDDPLTSCVLLAKPTKSRVLYTQMVGRCTRLEPGIENRLQSPPKAKPDALVIDIADNSGRHSLAGAGTLLGFPAPLDFEGRSVVSAARQIERIAAETPGLDVATLERISGLAAAAKACDLFRDATPPEVTFGQMAWRRHPAGGYYLPLPDGEITARETMLGTWEAAIRRDLHDPRREEGGTLRWAVARGEAFAKEEGMSALKARDAAWRSRPASEKQVRLLRRLGAKPFEGMTMGQASNALDALLKR